MADKEPRRRKKNRRDSQKKDDVRSEDQFFTPQKPETRDSDQEVEEEPVIHGSHHPSNVAKFVFVILFSGLVVSLSVIFISLRDVNEGPVDIFDMDHGDHHGETLHEEHIEDLLHDDHGEHEEPEESNVSFGDILPSLGSILSLNDEEVKEVETQDIPPSDKEDDDDEKDATEPITEPEVSVDQGILEEYIDDTSGPPESIEEPAVTEVYPDTTTSVPYSDDESLYSTMDYSELEDISSSSVQLDEVEAITEPVTSFYEEMPSTVDDLDNDGDDNNEDLLSMYERADITNEMDFEIRERLDEIEDIIGKSPDRALPKSEELLRKHPESPRLLYLKARALDNLAESQRSNEVLEKAIATYQSVMSSKNVPDRLYLLAGKRAADRMRFRGFAGKSVKLLIEMSEKFPSDIDLKNQVAIGYLMIGQNKLAKKVLLDVLKIAPDSGIAKVHLGFILKTDESNYEESIKYLSEGIASKEPGVIDGRFFFHLGDALHRTGKKEQALKVYEEAVKEGLFLSVYQRSLYNVNGLTGKPWWDPLKTRYAPDFKILEKHWMTIRDEAMSLLDAKYSGFLPEAEGLQEKGNWKQLELFARGRKLEKNCQKAPKTCALISQIPDAATCKRGQIKFSIMHPETHVWAHTGPTNCRLRAHLGLIVPDGASIRVAEETRQWEEGKVILFDDSFEHEVWHNGSTYRLVLIVDFWHPELTAHQKRSLTPI